MLPLGIFRMHLLSVYILWLCIFQIFVDCFICWCGWAFSNSLVQLTFQEKLNPTHLPCSIQHPTNHCVHRASIPSLWLLVSWPEHSFLVSWWLEVIVMVARPDSSLDSHPKWLEVIIAWWPQLSCLCGEEAFWEPNSVDDERPAWKGWRTHPPGRMWFCVFHQVVQVFHPSLKWTSGQFSICCLPVLFLEITHGHCCPPESKKKEKKPLQ